MGLSGKGGRLTHLSIKAQMITGASHLNHNFKQRYCATCRLEFGNVGLTARGKSSNDNVLPAGALTFKLAIALST